MKTNLLHAIPMAMTICVPVFTQAQKASDFENSREIILKGIEYHEEEQYKKAVSLYELVGRNDSLYITALTEKALSYIADENYEKAEEAARMALKSTEETTPELYTNLAKALDELGRDDEAYATYKAGSKIFPKNVQLIFNLGVSYYNNGKYAESIAQFKQVLEINPAHPGTHLMLASIAATEGQVVESLLSVCTFLMLEPNSSRSVTAISLLAQMAGTPENELDVKNIKLSDDDFADVELLLQNKISSNKKYKVPGDLGNFDVIKQVYLMIDKIEYNAADKGFWMQFYVPLFKQIIEEDKFEGFSYYILLSAENEAVKKILNKNISDLKAFDVWINDAYYEQHKMHDYVLNGTKKEAIFIYNDNGGLNLIGTIEKVGKESLLVGDYEVYHPSGALFATGALDKKGNKTGTAKYYDDYGRLTEVIEFKEDLYNGKYTRYYPNGVVSFEGNYVDGKAEGVFKEYYYYGGIYIEKNYKNGMLDGSYTGFFANGNKSVEATYVSDKLNGKVTRYYPTGQMKEELTYKDGLAEGEHKEYFADGKIQFVETLVKDEAEGPFKGYHSNGQLASEGVAKKTTFVGTRKVYYRNGSLKIEENYDETGKKNGISKNYAPDGKLYYTFEFTKGEISAYTYYDKSGKAISEGKRKLTKFPFVGMNEDGIKSFEGDYEGSTQNGLWKYYNEYGNLKTEQNYKNGLLDGKQTEYFEDGSVSSTLMWKNDMRDGKLIIYDDYGNIQEEGNYVEGEREGEWVGYYDNKVPEYRLYYIDDLQHGWQEYYDYYGRLESEYYMEEGIILKIYDYDSTGAIFDSTILDKELVEFDVLNFNRTTFMKGAYKNGERNGKSVWYQPGGAVETEGDFVNGERNGLWKWYHTNGALELELTYAMGNAEGIRTSYHPNGKVESKREFTFDEEDGPFVLYFDNGKTEREGLYVENLRYGPFNYYDYTGELQIVKNYVNDKVVSYTYKGTNGQLVPEVQFEGGTGDIVAYFSNGKKSVEYHVEKGWFQGPYKEYYATGKIYEEATYKNNNLEGVRKIYYANGKVKSEGNYVHDELHGLKTEYHENGQISESANYLGGVLFGERKLYDKTGKLIKTYVYYNGKIVSEK